MNKIEHLRSELEEFKRKNRSVPVVQNNNNEYREFVGLVSNMRKAQKLYSKMHTSDNHTLVKRLEKAVDDEIEKASLPSSDNQFTLF